MIEDILEGKLRSFSISGNAANPTFTCVEDRCFYSIDELQFYEITICEEGVNQEAKFAVINKMKGGRTLTYMGVPLIKRKLTKFANGDDWAEGEPTEVEEQGEVDAIKPAAAIHNAVNTEADLVQYLMAFKSLVRTPLGGLDIVLFDPKTGEVLLPE